MVPVGPQETFNVIITAVLLASIVTVILFVLTKLTAKAMKNSKKDKEKINLTGNVGKLKWVFTGSGQVAVFLTIFLVIVVAYILLRMTLGVS